MASTSQVTTPNGSWLNINDTHNGASWQNFGVTGLNIGVVLDLSGDYSQTSGSAETVSYGSSTTYTTQNPIYAPTANINITGGTLAFSGSPGVYSSLLLNANNETIGAQVGYPSVNVNMRIDGDDTTKQDYLGVIGSLFWDNANGVNITLDGTLPTTGTWLCVQTVSQWTGTPLVNNPNGTTPSVNNPQGGPGTIKVVVGGGMTPKILATGGIAPAISSASNSTNSFESTATDSLFANWLALEQGWRAWEVDNWLVWEKGAVA